MLHAMSVDVEDWFHAHNHASNLPHTTWDGLDQRVGPNVERLLSLFARHQLRVTFFVLGWVADRQPDLVRRIVDAGHEVGTHGYGHDSLLALGPDTLRDDVERSLEVLHKAGARRVVGYRAPSFSIVHRTWWALDVLRGLGLVYDSSVVPTGLHPDYGVPDAPKDPWQHSSGLWELPPGVAPWAGHHVPVGGAWFRSLPYAVTRMAMQHIQDAGRPAVFYLHPWELDAAQPLFGLSRWRRMRQRIGLQQTAQRLERLLTEFRFGTLGEVLGRYSGE